MKHITVLPHEAVGELNLRTDAVVLDCTLGAGGHTNEILSRLGAQGSLISLDVDPRALAAYTTPATQASHTLINANFRDIKDVSAEAGVQAYDGILADLGWRTEQFTEDHNKGFSFQSDEPLVMTFGEPDGYTFTAADIVNEWEEESLADIIFGYGEERAARKVAAAIVARRARQKFTTASDLASVIDEAIGKFYRRMRIHPATKTFQALRIAVNDELGALETLIVDGFTLLAPGGRMAIITFHSLEDRIVKHRFRSLASDDQATVITKRPLTAESEEITTNPRARSAKLRVIEKTHESHEKNHFR